MDIDVVFEYKLHGSATQQTRTIIHQNRLLHFFALDTNSKASTLT